MDLAELRALVEKATGPLEYGAAGLGVEGKHDCCRLMFGSGFTFVDYGMLSDAIHTNSVDAALALVERMRPGWRVELWVNPKPDTSSAGVYLTGAPEMFTASGTTPAIALLLALLDTLLDSDRGKPNGE